MVFVFVTSLSFSKVCALAFTLAHLSDAHLGPVAFPPVHYLLGKRAAGYANWHVLARKERHSMAVLEALVADLRAQKPDHIAMTGDLVNIGLPSEFAVARAFLGTLGAPSIVSVTPGNHDAYVKGAMVSMRHAFAPYMQGNGGMESQKALQNTSHNPEEPLFPFVRVFGAIALIGLCSGVPTPFFSARGTLGKAQLERLEMILSLARKEGLARIVMVHHAPHDGGARALRGLTDAPAFEAVIRQHGAELVLHGHNHRASLALRPWQKTDGGIHNVPILGVPSCSAKSSLPKKRAAYWLIKIHADAAHGKSYPSGRILASLRAQAERGIEIHERHEFVF